MVFCGGVREQIIQQRIRLALGQRPDLRLFRNNVGSAWAGRSERIARTTTITVHPGDVIVRQARPFHAGLAPGSADLIGIRSVPITQEHVGLQLGQFVSLEVKTDTGRPKPEQLRWQEMIQRLGGVAEIVRSETDATKAVGG